MADIVVYDDSPLAQYLLEIQGDQPDTELQHITVPVTEPGPAPESLGSRIAHNAADFLASLLEYLTLTFSASSSENDDTQFEERFKYFICTSPFLNKTVTVQAHERGRREMASLEFSTSVFHPGPFGYVLGVGTLATIITRSALARTRIARMPMIRPMLSRSAAVSLALASSLWMLRILQRRNTQSTQNQALRSLQLLINQCQALDAKVNRAIMVIQEIELVSRGYRLSTPLAPISRIEQASKTRRCNLVRAQLVTALVTSGALFQKSTETLQSHIDQKRLSTLLDMYNITPSSGPNSPAVFHGAPHDAIAWTASPTMEGNPMLPSTTARRNSMTHRRSRTMTGGSISRSRSRPASRPSSFHEAFNGPHPSVINEEHQRFTNSTTTPTLITGNRRRVRHSTSWSASEGEDSDPELFRTSPRSSGYSAGSPITAPEMTTLEKLRKNFQKMHGYRREFLCELLSIRRKTRRGRQGAKDYDKNWAVVRDVLQEGVSGLEAVVNELNKALDAELYSLPRIDTRKATSDNPAQDKQLQPFVHRLALLEQHVRGVQAKLYICNEDIRETVQEEPMDPEKRKLLESQFDSISQDISMMASEWQQGKTALMSVFDPPTHAALPMLEEASPNLDEDGGEEDSVFSGTVVDSMEHLEDQHGLKTLASKREEVFEGSTEDSLASEFGRRGMGANGVKMTRAERIQQQKQIREQEDAKKERNRDSSRMVHELKDVLGRRRHMRENDDEPESPTPASTNGSTSTVRVTLSPLLAAKSISYEQFFQAHESASLDVEHEEFISQVMEEVSPFTLDSPVE